MERSQLNKRGVNNCTPSAMLMNAQGARRALQQYFNIFLLLETKRGPRLLKLVLERATREDRRVGRPLSL